MSTSNLRILSHSLISDLLACPRKFQLTNYGLGKESPGKSFSADFGTAFGIGIAELLSSRDLDRAIFDSFRSWPYELSESDRSGRSIWRIADVLTDIKKFNLFSDLRIDTSADWRERTFAIVDSANSRVYKGSIDFFGYYADVPTVIDFKTSEYSVDEMAIVYSNQTQLLAYSVMVGAFLNVPRIAYRYILYSVKDDTFSHIHVDVTTEMIFEWLASIALNFQLLDLLERFPRFPKNGRSCFAYRRPCKFFSLCDSLPIPPPPTLESDIITLPLESVIKWAEQYSYSVEVEKWDF